MRVGLHSNVLECRLSLPARLCARGLPARARAHVVLFGAVTLVL